MSTSSILTIEAALAPRRLLGVTAVWGLLCALVFTIAGGAGNALAFLAGVGGGLINFTLLTAGWYSFLIRRRLMGVVTGLLLVGLHLVWLFGAPYVAIVSWQQSPLFFLFGFLLILPAIVGIALRCAWPAVAGEVRKFIVPALLTVALLGGGAAWCSEGAELELPNFIEVGAKFVAQKLHHPGAFKLLVEDRWQDLIFFGLIGLALLVLGRLAVRRGEKIPTGLQNAVELVVDKVYVFFTEVVGQKYAREIVPFVGTLFLFVLGMNLIGLVPFFKSATTNLSVTAGLALCTFFYVHGFAIRENGLWGYIKHLAGEPWWLFPINMPIHIFGELFKPLSLSIRLFANITAEDKLIAAFVGLGAGIMAALPYLPIPLQFPFYVLALLGSTIQALIFALLSAIYFVLMAPHEPHEHEPDAARQH